MDYVAHMTKITPTSTVASARIARFISETLGIEVIDTAEKANEVDKVGTLIIVNGPMAFCSFLEELGRLVKLADRVVWAQNDYTLPAPKPTSNAESPFRKAFVEKGVRPVHWTVCRENIECNGDVFISWNKLTYNPELLPVYPSKEPILFYHGAYRKNREPYFDKWFLNPKYALNISAPGPSATKFHARYPGAYVMKPLDWSKPVIATGAIYIADSKSCQLSHPPANRFFEMLSKGIPVWFDSAVAQSLRRSDFYLPDGYVVHDQRELYAALSEDPANVAARQRELWDRDYKGELKNELLFAWRSL